MMGGMDPEVRLLVISQLLVIIAPVGLLFALWIGMLRWGVSVDTMINAFLVWRPPPPRPDSMWH